MSVFIVLEKTEFSLTQIRVRIALHSTLEVDFTPYRPDCVLRRPASPIDAYTFSNFGMKMIDRLQTNLDRVGHVFGRSTGVNGTRPRNGTHDASSSG